MTYHFDLTADDYRDMNLTSFTWWPAIGHYLPQSLCIGFVVVFAAPWALEASRSAAFIAGGVAFSIALIWYCQVWRKRFLASVNRHYVDPSRSVIFGPHTLTLTQAGLESTGPMHRSFRDWRCVTEARVTAKQVLFYTAFGVVYLLPTRAVEDLPALEKWIAARAASQPNPSLADA
jgi:hypothetical protein